MIPAIGVDSPRPVKKVPRPVKKVPRPVKMLHLSTVLREDVIIKKGDNTEICCHRPIALNISLLAESGNSGNKKINESDSR